MSKYMVKEVNAETGEEIEREMNAEELTELKANAAILQAEKDAEIAVQSAKQAIFERLGITAEEAALLLK